MFIYRQDTEFLIVQNSVDDIIFEGTSSAYVEQMKGEFEMSMVGELSFFLGFSNIARRNRDLFLPRKICKESHLQVWNGQGQTKKNTSYYTSKNDQGHNWGEGRYKSIPQYNW